MTTASSVAVRVDVEPLPDIAGVLNGGELSLELLRFQYPTHDGQLRTILDIPRWEVEEGEQVLLRGISGSGKTTLLNVIAGIAAPTSGEVWLGELNLYAIGDDERDRLRAQAIGYVFQTHMLVPSLTIQENVELPLIFSGVRDRNQRRKRVTNLLDQLGLGECIARRPAQLSTGQRLRVAVARALVAEPVLLLADEPTAALDAENSALVVDLLQQLAGERKATLIVASHDPTLNSRFRRIVDLRQARLEENDADQEGQHG